MKIDVYTIFHNEQKLLPYFLRHYDKFAYRIFAFNDESKDDSIRILKANPKVILDNVEEHGLNGGYWVKELFVKTYENKSRGVVDWVIIADVDEIVYHPNLINILREQKSLGNQVIKCEGYTMIANSFPKTNGQIYDEIKLGLPDKWMNKKIIFDPSIYIRWRNGRHTLACSLRHQGVGLGIDTGIKLLHYRYFGMEYYLDRDKKNFSRYYIGQKVPKYKMNTPRHLPDGTRGSKYAWYENNKKLAINVVD